MLYERLREIRGQSKTTTGKSPFPVPLRRYQPLAVTVSHWQQRGRAKMQAANHFFMLVTVQAARYYRDGYCDLA